MKKITLIMLMTIMLSLFSYAQEIHKRITISNPNQSLVNQLTQVGIDFRCGADFEDTQVTLELSQSELNVLDQQGVNYTIEIDNLSEFYKNRIDQTMDQALIDLEIEKSITIAQRSSNSSVTVDNLLEYTGCDEINWTTPTNFNLGSMGGCLTVSEMESELNDMRTLFPSLISAKMDASSTGQKTWGNTQGTESWAGQTIYYVRITGNQASAEGTKPQTLYTSMIHCREVGSLMGNIYFMWYLLENYATDPAIQNLVDNNELYFIPVVNPDGLRWNEHIAPGGGALQRKNLRPNTGGTGNTSTNRGVDLNRNFDYFWGAAGTGSSGNQSSNLYRGPSAASEPETQILSSFVLARNFQTCIMNHTFANGIPHPYGGNPSFVSGREDEMHKWHADMTHYNRYVSGATIFTPANGIPDDWMVGGAADTNGSTGSGQNILATTPEHGDTGFWPPVGDIVPIAKRAMRIYFMTAYHGGKYAKFHDLTQSDISTLTSNLTFGIERLGQTASDFTLTVTPISANITNITSPATQAGMTILEQRDVTAQIILNGSIQANDKIEYRIQLSDSDGNIFYDANFEKYYQPSVLFSDNPDVTGTSNWTTSGGWVSTTTDSYSGSTSIKDGNAIPYANNATKTLTTTNSYNLSSASEVLVQFYTKWDLERNFDFVELQGSTNGSTWQTLCGKYTKPNATNSTNNAHGGKSGTSHSFQANNSSGQVYDGDQMDKWVMEEIVIDPANNNFLVGATTAQFRFRFRSDANNLNENYITSSDGFFIDDFKIIEIQIPCVTSVPNNLSVASITATTATANWDLIPSATYDLRYRVIGSPTWIDVLDLVTNSYSFSGLTASTDYETQVSSKCGMSNSAFTASTNFSTTAINYCNSNGNSTTDEYISNIQLNTINNASTVGTTSTGYSDFTNLSTDLDLNSNHTISVTKFWTGGLFNEAVAVWIDYNQNGAFEASEKIFNSVSSQTTPVSTNFNVPGTATLGTTRMRVIMKYFGSTNQPATDPCETFNFGEVEDYTVNITDATLGVNGFDLNEVKVYPNPFNSIINIKLPNQYNGNAIDIELFDITGRTILKVDASNIENNVIQLYNIDQLSNGTYFIKVIDNETNTTVVKQLIKQ